MKRNLLPVSSVSLFGSCETKFIESILGKVKVTQAMLTGKKMHDKLTEDLPKITIEETLEKIKSGEECAFREVTVVDKKLKIIGRIDQLEFHGEDVTGKNSGTIVDDKYPTRIYPELPMNYKLQLALYTAAVHNSENFSKCCTIHKAKLVCRDKRTHDILKIFDVDEDELKSWEARVPIAAKLAWEIFENKKEPEHRRFDISTEEWTKCYCDRPYLNFKRPKMSATLQRFF